MLLLRRPSESAIRAFLARQGSSSLSYPEVGASRDGAPKGYHVDRYRIRLGEGREVFDRARDALRDWKMFDLGWLTLYRSDPSPVPGTDVALAIRHFGFWSLNAGRVVYLVDEDGPVQRSGFGYGTLEEHAERGEERFLVEWHSADDSVWYDVVAFSQVRSPLARLGYPATRWLQKRFARDSKRVMLEAARGDQQD